MEQRWKHIWIQIGNSDGNIIETVIGTVIGTHMEQRWKHIWIQIGTVLIMFPITTVPFMYHVCSPSSPIGENNHSKRSSTEVWVQCHRILMPNIRSAYCNDENVCMHEMLTDHHFDKPLYYNCSDSQVWLWWTNLKVPPVVALYVMVKEVEFTMIHTGDSPALY